MAHPDYVNIGTPEVKAIEECSELMIELARLTQALCKVDRFGWFNRFPKDSLKNNMDDVQICIEKVYRELEDVDGALTRLKLRMKEVVKNEEEG